MQLSFIGIGTQKAGTSTLHDILKQHTQLYLPEVKEAQFFNFTEEYLKGLPWFMDTFFPNAGSERILGEITPDYLYMDNVPERIAETFGKDLKFIVVLRHPVDRAVSHYNMEFRRGIETLDFFEAIEKETQRIRVSEMYNREYSYLSKGLYGQQLKRFFEIFPKENFLILIFEEDIKKNIQQTIVRIQDFLGLNQELLDCEIKSNEAYEPYSIQLNRIVQNHKLLKGIGRFLFPFVIRKKIREMIFQLNKKPDSKASFSLSKEHKEKLFHDYFDEDIKLLESLTEINFNKVWSTK